MAGNQNVSFTFSINNDNFNSKIQAMNKEMKTFEQEIKQASNDILTNGKNLQTLGSKYTAINKALEQAKEKVKLYEQQIDKQNSSIEKSKNKLTELGKKKEKVNKTYEESVKVTGKESEASLKLKEELDKLNQQYKNTEKSITSKEKTLQNYAVSLSQAQTQVSNLEVELKNCSDAIEEQSDKFVQASEKFTEVGSSFEKVGGSISDVGDEAQKAGALLLTASAALAKMASGFESGLAKVNTLVNDSSEGMKAYGQEVMDLSNNTGVAVTDLTDALYDAISAGVDYSKSTEFINDVNKVAVGGFTDIASASNLLTQVMNIYGKSVEDVGDISNKLFLVQKNGVTTVGQLASSMGEAMTMGASYNVNLENILSSYASLTKQGRTASTAQTQLKAMIQELGDTGSSVGEILKDKTAKSFTELMKEGNSLYDVLKIVKDSCNGNEDAFNNLWSSTEAGLSAMSLLSKDGEYFNSTLNDMANSAGLTDEAFNTIAETSEFKFKKSINEAKNSLIKLGESLLPLMDDVSDGISTVAEFISKLNPEVVTSIAKFGALALVFGTVMKATGGLVTVLGKGATGISSFLKIVGDAKELGSFTKALGKSETAIGGLIKSFTGLGSVSGVLASSILPVVAVLGTLTAGVYAYKKGNDAINKTVAESRGEYTTLEKVMASLMGVQLRSREELEELGLVYKDFNENISDEFQESVKDMTTDIHEFGLAMSEINVDGVFSEEEANAMTSRVDSALKSTISAIESKSQEMQEGLSKAFSVDGVIDESENALLEYWNNRSTKEKEEAQNLQNEINNIILTARNEGRTLNPEEEAKIRDYYAQIKQIELEALASNQYEIEYVTQEFQNRISTMDAESAKELLGQRYEEYNEQQIATKSNYDTLIAMAKENYDNLSQEEKAQVDETVKRLEDARDEELRINKEKYDANLQYAYEHNENLKTEFNRFTGELVAEKDRAYYEEYEQMLSHYQDIESITESGYKRVHDTATGTWKDVYVSIDATTGQLKGVYDLNTQNVAAMTKSDESALRDEVAVWNETKAGLLSNCLIMGDAYIDAKGNITDSSNEIIGKLIQVEDENGNLVDTIVDANNTPLKIGENTADVIKKIKDTQQEIKNTDGKKANIIVTDNGTASTVQKNIDNIAGKTVIVGVEYKNGKPTYNGSTIYATGTAGTPTDQIATVNENTTWELVDTPSGKEAVSLGRSLLGEMAYLPENTRVTTALASTQKMEQSIQREVSSQVSNSNEQVMRAINNLSNAIGSINKNNNTNLNLDDVLDKIVIETVTNLNDREIMRVITPLIDKNLNKYNKVRGR